MSRSKPSRWVSSCRTRSSARCSSATRGRPVRARPASTRATRSSTSSRSTRTGASPGQLPADGAVVLAWSDRELLPVEIEGQVARRTAQRPVVPAGRHLGQRQDHVPPGPAAQHGRRRATPRSSTRTRSTSTSGRARPSSPIRPISFDGTIDATPAGDRLQLRRVRRPGSIRKPIKPLDTIPVACGDNRRSQGCVQRASSTVCPRSSCTT